MAKIGFIGTGCCNEDPLDPSCISKEDPICVGQLAARRSIHHFYLNISHRFFCGFSLHIDVFFNIMAFSVVFMNFL